MGGDIMELKDTIEGMISSDYKERFKAEYNQLRIRRKKLWVVLEKDSLGELDFELTSPTLLHDQLVVMDNLLSILEERAELEGVKLNE